MSPQLSDEANPLDLHADACLAVRNLCEFSSAGVRVSEYLDFLNEQPSGVWRECLPGHITASALVVDEGFTSTLLTLHPKVGRWLQLGGHIEPGDASVREAARREVIEESGLVPIRLTPVPIHLDTHPVPCGGQQARHWDVQYLAICRREAPIISSESLDVAWFPLDGLPTDLDASVRALIQSADQCWQVFGDH
jgi:8-oxo-dGTP pyrophosphatase MutT (NUDIX family)